MGHRDKDKVNVHPTTVHPHHSKSVPARFFHPKKHQSHHCREQSRHMIPIRRNTGLPNLHDYDASQLGQDLTGYVSQSPKLVY